MKENKISTQITFTDTHNTIPNSLIMKCDPISKEKIIKGDQPQMAQILRFSEKDIKADTITMLNEVKDICS